MGKSEPDHQMPESTKRLIAAILKVKPTADMPRPGAKLVKPKAATRKAERSK